MYYKTKIKDYIRVPPRLFGLPVQEAVLTKVKEEYAGYIDKDLGIIIDVSDVTDIKDGIIVPGDGASYYETEFELLNFKPELQEVIPGKIKDIADFGVFITLGPIDGMIHISQTMDDFVSLSKDKCLLGKDSKKTLKVGDMCRGRIIAVSFKDITNPKIGLTMRQPGLGRFDWIEEDLSKSGGKSSSKEEKPKK